MHPQLPNNSLTDLLFCALEDRDLAFEVLSLFSGKIARERKEKLKELDMVDRLLAKQWKQDQIKPAAFLLVAFAELSKETREAKLQECKEARATGKNIKVNAFPLVLDFSDYSYWARKRMWSPLEAATVSVGLIPSNDVVETLAGFGRKECSCCKLLSDLFERKELIVTAINAGNIKRDGNPVELIDWFEQNEFPIPNGLAYSVRKFQGGVDTHRQLEKVDKLGDRERESLLRLIAAMSIRGYAYNPELARNQATKDIQSDLDSLGIGLDQTTILKWLREAANSLPDDTES